MTVSHPENSSHRPVVATIASTLSITLGALPIFLVGALAVFIRPEIGFSETRLGALATTYYLASAIFNVVGGRVSERLGGARTMGLAASLSLTGSLGIALVADTWLWLAFLLTVAGIGNGLAYPASNLALTRGVPSRHQGVAFGIKQSAGPYAVLLAGASVPLIGLTIGWRWAFGLAALVALPIIWGGRNRQAANRTPAGDRHDVELGPLWVLSAAAFFAVNGSASLGAFYVESAVSAGTAPGLAGTFLALGSFVGIVMRIGWGWVADRRPQQHFVIVPTLLALGALAFSTLGRVDTTALLFGATVFVFATGWAWPGVFSFAVVQRSQKAPGIASGIIGAGQYGGGILGPLVFGMIVERNSYRTAWTVAGGMVFTAALLALGGGRWLEHRTTMQAIEGATT